MFKPYKMRCPKCKTPVTVKKESYIGRKVACKECNAKFVVKAPGGKSSSSGQKKSPRKKVKSEVGQDSEFMLALDKLNLADESQSIKSLPQAPGRKSNVRRMEEKKASKDKKKIEKKKDSISPAVMLGGILLTVAVIGGGGYLLKDYVPVDSFAKLEPPKEFTWYTDENKSFSMEFPAGWEVEGAGGVGGKPLWARSKKGFVTIGIRDSMSGSAIGDISSRPAGGQVVDENGKAIETPDELKPEAQIHEYNLSKAEQKYDKYEEQRTFTAKCGMGEMRISEFTCSTMLSGEYSGIRATYRTPRYQLTLYCDCPTADFRDMKGAFMRIAGSVKSGGPPN